MVRGLGLQQSKNALAGILAFGQRRGARVVSDGTIFDPTSFPAAYAAFRQSYPAFEQTSKLDALRATEYARLDTQGHIYLDYTGGSLYAESQLRAHLDLLRHHVFGNPHSTNPTSRDMTERAEQARAGVLSYFNASPDEYTAIFTPNASGALKLVGEAYPFAPDGRYLLTFDNHNSVNGIREFARAKGATTTYVPLTAPDLRVDEVRLWAELDRPAAVAQRAPKLFAYPAQSNYSGVQHPLEWIEAAQERGWDVLVDGSAFVPTNRLDLSVWHPDFVPLSFYKMFGYPTGVGCLLARKEALARLRRPWFGGGTIRVVSVQGDLHYMHDDEVAFEDGTINYLSLPAVEIGLQHLQAIGLQTIHERVMCLTGWLLDTLLSLQHRSGVPLVQIYGPRDCRRRGATIAFNVLDPHGRIVGERVVERRANAAMLSLRTGCLCNPGAREAAFHLPPDVLSGCAPGLQRGTREHCSAVLGLASVVRVSLGVATNFADVYRLVEWVRTFLDSEPIERDLPPQRRC
ncbi:MAG TPA: aminotransferase class V-fold PLP-dependent enzyme [Chloroflexota bacterium]|nr:aminotransferase class V-fold PLP-dependent enzyme [Chloroflexota bacterium]